MWPVRVDRGCAVLFPGQGVSVARSQERVAIALPELLELAGRLIGEAVSYTHLDVYKRQAHDIARAVRMVGVGMTVFQPQSDGDAALLSPREREVLDLIAAGSTNREIAAALHLSPHTIHEHTSSLYRKLGARNRADAVQRANRAGLTE